MADLAVPKGTNLAVRCHDITVTLDKQMVGDFEQMLLLGMAVRLALHLRGANPVSYELLKQVGLHLLHIPPTSIRQVLELLGEIEFVKIDKEGSTIRTVIPTIPFYEDLYERAGEFGETLDFTENEQLTLAMLDRLSRSPTTKGLYYDVGAERKLVDKVLNCGIQGGYFLEKRARGREMLLSPAYFPENADSFADLAAGAGSGRVASLISKLSRAQGWPLKLLKETGQLDGVPLAPDEIEIATKLAGDGFAPPPAIQTSHAGTNHFLFTPKPGFTRITPQKRHIYEAAMALVAAVRQGQLLPANYRIKYPLALLNALYSRGYVNANSEALEQYRSVAILRVGRLIKMTESRFRFELIRTPDNEEAVQMAIALIQGNTQIQSVDQEIVLAIREGHQYLDSLVGRNMLVKHEPVQLDPDTRQEIDDLLLRGVS